MAGSGVPLLSESLLYDHRGKVVREIGSSTDMAYTGLGHLKRMSHSPGIVSRYTVETFEPNGLGLVLRDSTRVDVASDGTPGGSGYPDITAHNASYGPGGRLAGKTAEWTPVTEEEDDSIAPGTWTGLEFSRNYDAATGDLLSAGSTTEAWVPQARDGARSATTFAHVSDAIHESRSYYSADGMLRVHQANRAKRDGLETTPHLDTLDGVYEVYWYDALGRRVLKRSIQKHGELCDRRHVTCHDTIERFVWDGSQILAEVRATDASNAAAGGPAGPQTGRIVYVHPGGVDAPAGMVRNGVSYALHANWRGLYAFATDSLGRKAEESTVEWPANNRRAFLGRADRRDWVWFGSLVSSGTDASGLLYRRNRYYDPQSGQFTQQDPIGIAGGLNLYGFAGGDPVNNADPFGLCPPELTGRPCLNPLGDLSLTLRTSPWNPEVGMFGPTRTNADGSRREHRGVDLLAPDNHEVRATDQGTVVRVAYEEAGAGHYLIVGHPGADGTPISYSYYFHLANAPQLQVGQSVGVGDIIGLVGRSGNITNESTHLHFEIREGRAQADAINPWQYLRLYRPNAHRQ